MKLIYRLLFVFVFIISLGFVIAYARGYRIDLNKKTFSSTGILAVSSNPKAAKVLVNGDLKGVTDLNIGFPPGPYNVEIKKDGYTSWSKKIILKGELVISLDALLFPLNPSLSPLTNLGIVKAIALDQTDKILLFTDNNDSVKDGIYLFDAGKKPLSLFAPLKLLILKKNFRQRFNFASVTTYLSPDFKQVIIEFPLEKTNSLAYLLSLEEENTNVFDITTSKNTLLEAWNKEKETNNAKILEIFPKEVAKIATDSFHIISFSPNETKLFYQSKKPIHLPFGINPPLIATNQTSEVRDLKKDHYYIYDSKEDKNFEIENIGNWFIPKNSEGIYLGKLEIGNFVQWYPDSKHLVLNNNKKISVIDYDGNNKQSIYSGPFDESFFAVTGDGSLITLLNLNPETNKFPDLYAVGIK